MKKVVSIFLLACMILLTGCGHSITKTLTSDGGKWEADGFGVSTQLSFYEDGTLNVTERSSNFGGTYKYDEKENKLTISLDGLKTTILTDVKETDSNKKLEAQNGKRKVSFTRIEEK